MRVHTLTELMHLSRTALFDLAARITTMLPHYSEHAPERFNANINLRNIRRELLRREWSPRGQQKPLPVGAGRGSCFRNSVD
jgi:hypothetical protein